MSSDSTNVSISYPKQDGSVPFGRFLVYGTAGSAITHVDGILTVVYPGKKEQQQIAGVRSTFYPAGKSGVPPGRWAITFAPQQGVPQGTVFTVKVTGYDAKKNDYPSAPRIFFLKPTVGAIQISWAVSDTDISDDWDDFTPWGTLGGYDLASAQLTIEGTSTIIDPISTVSDLPHEMWNAVFPSLCDGKYDLTVTDANGGTDHALRLSVTGHPCDPRIDAR